MTSNAAEREGPLRPSDVRVYVNERGVSVPPGSTALDAVRAFSPEQAGQIASGIARLADSRGLPIDAACTVSGGLILRVLPVRDRSSTDAVGTADAAGTADGAA